MRLEMEDPGTRLDAPGAKIEIARESSLVSEYRPCPPWAATYYWDDASHSVQPLHELGRALT